MRPFLPFKRQKGVESFFTESVTESEFENHRHDQTAEVMWVKATSSYYQFSPDISGSLKNVGLSLKRRKKTYLLRIQYRYSVSSTNQAAFFIGGYGSQSSVIAKYENDNWSLHGNLKRRRNAHGSITYGTTIIVIGGGTDDGS